ncbi:class II glutamine amidotransferase [Tateyamaria sp.]|uniref:class II glutamine amidotransferase n=1 Tax=Tateyamaria sp. TaxID=1929288 RepID=UPI00329D4D6F
MCRWGAYLGAPVFLSDEVTSPCNSLIQQASAAEQSISTINADGFGLAWYDHRSEPGHYRDVYPAWSDANLASLTQQVRSGLFLAHVRASTGTAISRNNCHPFVNEDWSFMHNGQVGGYERFRKAADMAIPDALYASRKGATDSEAMFLIALGMGLKTDPRGGLQRATGAMIAMGREAEGTDPLVRMTVAMSDGKRLYAARYANDPNAPSLYYRWSAASKGWSVVSEPYNQDEDWQEVPSGSFCTFDGEDCKIEPFAPE